LLALVAGQDVEQQDDGTWQIVRTVAPDRVISVVDAEARHMHKSRSEYRFCYKAHIAIEPETGLVTAHCAHPDQRDRWSNQRHAPGRREARTPDPRRWCLWIW
jgi:predicted nucleotidyltransferase